MQKFNQEREMSTEEPLDLSTRSRPWQENSHHKVINSSTSDTEEEDGLVLNDDHKGVPAGPCGKLGRLIKLIPSETTVTLVKPTNPDHRTASKENMKDNFKVKSTPSHATSAADKNPTPDENQSKLVVTRAMPCQTMKDTDPLTWASILACPFSKKQLEKMHQGEGHPKSSKQDHDRVERADLNVNVIPESSNSKLGQLIQIYPLDPTKPSLFSEMPGSTKTQNFDDEKENSS